MNFSPESACAIRAVTCQRTPLGVRAAELEFARGTFHLLRGAAESGHELLLRLLGLLEVAEEGEVFVEGAATRALTDDARLKLRERRLGFIFTAPFLLPAFTVIENVAMPLFKISDVEPTEARRRSERLLDFAGLTALAATPCADLSPLAQRRVALARALVNEPAVVLVENLDATLNDDEQRTFAELLREAAAEFRIAVIATALPAFAPAAGDRVIDVCDGVARAAEPLPRADA